MGLAQCSSVPVRRLVLAYVCLLLPAAARAHSIGPGYVPPAASAGPFAARTSNPLRIGILDPMPMRADVLAVDHWSASFHAEYVSIFFHDVSQGMPLFDSDGELARYSLSLTRGMGDRLDTSVELPLFHWESGFLDSALKDYHEIFDLPNSGRDRVPRNRLRQRLLDRDGRTVWEGGGYGLKLGDLTLSARKLLCGTTADDDDGDSCAVSARAMLKLPTGNPSAGLSNGAIDASVGLLASWHGWPFGIDGNLDFVVPGGSGFAKTDDYSVRPYGKLMVALELGLTRWLYAVAQGTLSTPVILAGPPNMDDVDGVPSLGVVGGQLRLGALTVHGAVAEDLSFGEEADVSILLGVSYAW